MSATKQSRGTVDSAPCPWCKKPQSFKGVADYGVVERDICYQCVNDKNGKGCGRHYVIARVQPVTLIWLEQFTGDPRHPG